MPPRAPRPRGLFGRLWRDYLRRYWPRMALATVLMVIEGSTLAVLSWMLKPLFDRVFVGRAEIGAAWTKRSNEGRDYLSVKLDDPSFTAPIFANLFDDEDGKSYNLIWSRARRTNGD